MTLSLVTRERATRLSTGEPGLGEKDETELTEVMRTPGSGVQSPPVLWFRTPLIRVGPAHGARCRPWIGVLGGWACMSMPEDRYVRVGEAKTRYWAEGADGSSVILIHGIGGYVEHWLPSFGSLAEQHHVYALDMLGHGRTDKPPDASYEIADLARFVRDFMEALGIERAAVVGHSLGGAIATRLALTYPSAVSKLVLVASAGFGKEVCMELRLCTTPVVGEALTRPSRSASAQNLKMCVHDQTLVTDESIEFDFEMASLPGAQRSFLKTLRACGGLLSGQSKNMCGPNLDGIGSMDVPVMVVWGRQDKVIPVEHAEVAATGIQNVRVEIFDQCGHTPMLEHPEAFNEVLLEFLAD